MRERKSVAVAFSCHGDAPPSLYARAFEASGYKAHKPSDRLCISMIPESELVGCRQCGAVFWGKAKVIVQSQGEPECPVCGSRNVDDIDRST